MKLTLAQLNPTIGDFEGNLNKLKSAVQIAVNDNSDLIVFSELYLCGYPPRDLLERPDFISRAEQYLNRIVEFSKSVPNLGILVGTVSESTLSWGKGLHNSGILIENGKILFIQHKTLLPTYDVFDEARYFDAAESIDIFEYKGEILGVTICEDAWNEPDFLPQKGYKVNPLEILYKKGATLFLNLSSSPFHTGKIQARYNLMQKHIHKYPVPFVFVNQIAGNDELIFDGNSMVFNKDQSLQCHFPGFIEHVQTINMSLTDSIEFQPGMDVKEVYQALILGIKDYVHKCGFQSVVLGLSGGIDSAVVCALSAAALGSENVLAITMPSQYSSEGSVSDSEALAGVLGIDFKTIPIKDIFSSYLNSVESDFKQTPSGVAEENVQARIRGDLIMAFSNKFNHLALSTGNKSELAMGYCTLYGDMSGGLSVIADIPKLMVYELARYINRDSQIIPENIITKPPSAELKPDQKDEDTLPPYSVLDKILYLYLDQRYSKDKIIEEGFDAEIVNWVIRMFNRNEYKRRQAAPGLKVTSKAFGVGRRMPIAAKYHF